MPQKLSMPMVSILNWFLDRPTQETWSEELDQQLRYRRSVISKALSDLEKLGWLKKEMKESPKLGPPRAYFRLTTRGLREGREEMKRIFPTLYKDSRR